MSRGTLSQETIDAIKAVILDKDSDKGLVDMIITHHPPNSNSLFDYVSVNGSSNVENCGCVWSGSSSSTIESEESSLSFESVADLVYWIIDCDQYMDDSAFLEPTGYIYHLDKRGRRDSTASSTSSIHTTSNVSGTTQSISESASHILTNPTSIFTSLPSVASSTVSTVAKGSMDGLSNLMYYSSFGFINTKSQLSKDKVIPEGPADDVNDSQFLIGIEGNLDTDQNDDDGSSMAGNNRGDPLDDITDPTYEEEHFRSQQQDLHSTNFTYKRVMLSFKNKPDSFAPYNIIIFRRRPFIFTLIFESKSPILSDKKYYRSLYNRLASLTEPIYSDLNISSFNRHPYSSSAPKGHNHRTHKSNNSHHSLNSIASNSSLSMVAPVPSTSPSSANNFNAAFFNNTLSGKRKKVYYLVHDPNRHIVQYSLPEIISYQTLFQLASEAQNTKGKSKKSHKNRRSSSSSTTYNRSESPLFSGQSNDPEFLDALAKREELIHVHQVMAHICLQRHPRDTEKFIRTAKGWSVYWAKLKDKREVVVAGKWGKTGKPPSDPISGILQALGNEENVWANEDRTLKRAVN